MRSFTKSVLNREVIRCWSYLLNLKDFLTVQADREYLEGTTAAGKTTVGIFKFMLMVAKSNIKYHVLAGADIGTVEKNVINSERGLLEQLDGLATYNQTAKAE